MIKQRLHKPLFVETKLCTSRMFCEQCRDCDAHGLRWRAIVATVTRTPDELVDFDCPFGVAWANGKGPTLHRSRGLGDTIEKITKRLGVKPCGGCIKRRDWLNKKIPYAKAR